MASTLSVGGLASGIDTNSLIDSLSSIEGQKVTAIEKRKSQSQATLTALGDLQSKFMGFAALARDLNDMTDFDMYKSTSSDATAVELTGGTEGLEGAFSVRVQQLASSWKVASKQYSSSTTDLNLAGTLRLSRTAAAVESDPTKLTVDVNIAHGDTLKDIASKINAADNAGVSATLITVGPGDIRLMLTAIDAGSDTFTMSSVSGDDIASSLGVLNSTSQTRTSDFVFRKQAGGPATATTTMAELYTGIGANNIGLNDSFTLTGTDSNGSTVTETFPNPLASGALGASTVGDLATWLGSKLTASVSIDSSGRLVATNSSGTAIDFTLSMTGGSTGTVPLGGSTDQRSFNNVVAEGRKAFYTLNGLSIASDSNTDEDTLSGAKVQLKNITQTADPDVQLTLKRDDAGIEGKVNKFLTSYNELMAYIDSKSKGTIKESQDAKGQTVRTYVPGEFTGQSVVQNLKSTLQNAMTSIVSGISDKTSYTSLASVGITTSKSDGTLSLDSKKFQKALNNDFDGVRRLFSNSGWTNNPDASVGGWTQNTKPGSVLVNPGANTYNGVAVGRSGDVLTGGAGDFSGLGINAPTTVSSFTANFARGVAGIVEQFYNSATSVDGILRGAKTNVQNQVTEYGKQSSTAQSRVDSYREQLVKQFSAMEQAMLRIKSQSSAFMSQIGSLG